MRKSAEIRDHALVFVALLVLLATTFGLAHLELGRFNLFVSLFIAILKAGLVAVFYMDLRESSGVHRLASALGIFWLAILFTLALSDFLSRDWTLLPGYGLKPF